MLDMESLDYLTRVRRHLHTIPELSEQEYETSDYIVAQLREMGYKPRRIKTGVVCDAAGESREGKIALRADMDALPIIERTGLPFASTNGRMHACGHDGHTAMLLETARILKETKPPQDVRLLFQFGEEGSGGAEQMIEAGVLDGIDRIYALHMCPELDTGRAASVPGAMFAGTVEFDVAFTGRASHCADREKGLDTLAAADLFVSRRDSYNESSKSNTLFHIGSLTAGSARNIVADHALAKCTLRYFDENDREATMMKIAAALADTDNRFGTSHRLTVLAVYPPLLNSGAAFGAVKTAFPALEECAPRFTAEDFAFYTQKTDGCMVWLGCRDENHTSPLHSDTFGFDERALVTGVQIFTAIVYGKNHGK